MNLFSGNENSYSSVFGLILKLDTTNQILKKLLELIDGKQIIDGKQKFFEEINQVELINVTTQFTIPDGRIDLVIEILCGDKRYFVYFEVKVRAKQEHGEQIDCYSNYVEQQNKNNEGATHILGILTIHDKNEISWKKSDSDTKGKIQFAVRWQEIVKILQEALDPGVARLAGYFCDDIKKEVLVDWENYELQQWNGALSFPALIDGAYYLGKALTQAIEVPRVLSGFNYYYEDYDQHFFYVKLGNSRSLYVYWVYYKNDAEFKADFEKENFSKSWGTDLETVRQNVDRYDFPGTGFYAGCLWVGTENNGTNLVKIMKLSKFEEYFRPGQGAARLALRDEIVEGFKAQ